MINREKNSITKVILYEIEFEGDKIVESAIFRKNGIQLDDKEAGIDALYQLAKEKRCKSIKELENTNYFEVLSEEKLKEKYPKIYKIAKGDYNDLESSKKNVDNDINSDSFEETYNLDEFKDDKHMNKLLNLDKMHIKMFLIKASIYCIAAGFTLVGSYKIVKKAFDSSSKKTSITQENESIEEELSNISTTEYETAADMLEKYGSVDEILAQSNINQTKATAISNVWSYLKQYNKTISDKHKMSISDTRLAHTWDEVIINYLAYNDINQDEACKIFDNYNIDITILKEAYQSGYNQDLLAYTVLKESTNKSDLINSQEGKDFYQKYENLIIKYNQINDKTHDDKNLEKIIKKIYKTIRRDFDINQPREIIENYKLSVIPIIVAFDNTLTNSNYDNTLTRNEKDYFNQLADFSKFESKISDLSNSLYSYNLAVSPLEENQEEYTYSQIKDVAITELNNDQAYNIEDVDRNIADHSEYQEKFIKKATKTKKVTKTTDTTEKNSNKTNTYKKQNNSINYDDAAMIKDDEKDTKIPSWMLEDNNQEDATEKVQKSTSEITDDETNNSIYDVQEDTPSTTNNNDNPNYDDSIKDITTDDTNVDSTVPLPNPNENSFNKYQITNEIVADYIIDEMTNNSSLAQYNYQYTKR